MDVLIPNNAKTEKRLREPLEGKEYKRVGHDFYIMEDQPNPFPTHSTVKSLIMIGNIG